MAFQVGAADLRRVFSGQSWGRTVGPVIQQRRRDKYCGSGIEALCLATEFCNNDLFNQCFEEVIGKVLQFLRFCGTDLTSSFFCQY